MVNPETLAWLQSLGSSPKELMRLLSKRVSEDAIAYIAAEDYGFNQDKNSAALRRIQAGEVMPVEPPDTWIPREVIELFRWREFGDSSTADFPGNIIDFHVARAFCCAAWLEAYATTDRLDLFDGPNTNLVLLLYSLEEAGPQFEQAAPPLFAWLLTKLTSEHDEHPFFILALVWSLIRSPHSQGGPDILSDLIDWLLEEEKAVRIRRGGLDNWNSRWLLGTTGFDLRHSYWSGLSEGFVAAANKTPDVKLAARLLGIGEQLAG